MEEEPAPKRARTEQNGVLGEEAIHFRIVSPRVGVNETFVPLMTHQVLGEEEMINGYTDPVFTVSLNLATYEFSTSFTHNGVAGKATEVRIIYSLVLPALSFPFLSLLSYLALK